MFVLVSTGVGVRPDVELEVVGGGDALRATPSSTVSTCSGRSRACIGKRGHALDREVDQHPECAEAERDGRAAAAGRRCARRSPAAVTSRCAADAGRQPTEAQPGAVGAGRGRTGEGLHVDVAEVLHGEAERPEQPGQLVQVGAGAEGDEAAPSDSSTPSIALMSSWMPSVAAIGVKLCPAPTVFSVRPRSRAVCTAATTSSTERAWMRCAG